MSRIQRLVTFVVAALLAASAAHALINPGFTPVQLVKQASVILWVDINDRMLMTVWHGGTDTMHRAVDYIQTDDDPKVPVAEGFAFSKGPLKLASLTGAIRAVRTVDLAGDGKLALFVASESGDRLFAGAKERTFADLTGARGLQSKSVAFASGDFAGQGRLDLISFDGKVVTLNAQQADGKFLAKPLDIGSAMTTAFRENSDADRAAMMAAAVLPVSGACKGPVGVTGWIDQRCLGAWNVLPGVSQACFGRTEAGPVTLKWRLPGGKKQTKEVVLEKGGVVKVEIK
jgi:hypothetical protein